MFAQRIQRLAGWTGVGLILLTLGCGRANHQTQPAPRPMGGATGVAKIDLPTAESRPGIAVVILVDTSGSMAHSVSDKAGQRRPKHEIAIEALDRIVEQTDQWKKKNPDKTLQFGIVNFSSGVGVLLPVGDFDAAKARAAVQRLPNPNSGTAIGRAIESGFKSLYATGLARKYLVCITDGENTSGPSPEAMSRQLHSQTSGEVETHFIAFDTSARQFAFVKEVNGHVVQAADGKQLQEELIKIYDKRILAEKPEPETPK